MNVQIGFLHSLERGLKRNARKMLLLSLLLLSVLSIYPFYPFSQCKGCQRNPNRLIPTIYLSLVFYSGNTTAVNTLNSTLFSITNFFVILGPITGGLQLDGTSVPLTIGFDYSLKNYPYIGKVNLTITTPEKVYPNSTGPSLVSPLKFWTNSTNTLGTPAGQSVFSPYNPRFAYLTIPDAFTSSDLWSTEILIWIDTHPALQTWQFEVSTDTLTSIDGSESSPSPPAFEHLGASGYGQNIFYWTVNAEFGSFTVSMIRPIWVELRPLYLSFLTVIIGFYIGSYKYERRRNQFVREQSTEP